MDPTHGLTSLAIGLGVIVIALIIGVFRRRYGLQKAQRLAPDTFVFRFSIWGDFGTQLPRLPATMLVTPRSGTGRVASVSATPAGLVIWQVDTATQLAKLPWSEVANISASTTLASVGLSSISYPTVRVEIIGSPDGPITLPFLSANSRFFWPRTSKDEVDRIVTKLTELREGLKRVRADS